MEADTMLSTIAQALASICFSILLGWLSGKAKIMPADFSKALARFVIVFALPIALFIAAAKVNAADIFNVRILFALFVGFGATFLIGYLAGRLVFERSQPECVMQALTCSFPNIAYCGPPILTSAVGASAVLMVVTGNLIITLVIVPIALMLLGKSSSDGSENIGAFTALKSAVTQPLVFLPITGALIASLGLKLPPLLVSTADSIGAAAGGTALFALGLALSAVPFRFDREIGFNVVVKNVIQPVLIFAAAWLIG
jgi:malonate transporter and related proteins